MMGYVNIYIDASYPSSRNKKLGRYVAVIELPRDSINLDRDCYEVYDEISETSRNRLFLHGVINGLENVIAKGYKAVSIFTNNLIVINILKECLARYKNKTWSKISKTINNLDLMEVIYRLIVNYRLIVKCIDEINIKKKDSDSDNKLIKMAENRLMNMGKEELSYSFNISSFNS
jgi:ribonuclease HI